MNRQCRRIPSSIDTSLKKGDRPSTGNMLTHSQALLPCINEVFFFGGRGGLRGPLWTQKGDSFVRYLLLWITSEVEFDWTSIWIQWTNVNLIRPWNFYYSYFISVILNNCDSQPQPLIITLWNIAYKISIYAQKMLANPVEALLFTCKQPSFSDHVLEHCCAVGYITSLAKSAIKSMRIE